MVQFPQKYHTYHNLLDVVLVGLPELGADLGLGPAHVLDLRGRDGDGPLNVEGVDVADGGHRDLGGSLLHDLLDGCPSLTDDPSNEVVVRQNLMITKRIALCTTAYI